MQNSKRDAEQQVRCKTASEMQNSKRDANQQL
jgi:hypothetical protein